MVLVAIPIIFIGITISSFFGQIGRTIGIVFLAIANFLILGALVIGFWINVAEPFLKRHNSNSKKQADDEESLHR